MTEDASLLRRARGLVSLAAGEDAPGASPREEERRSAGLQACKLIHAGQLMLLIPADYERLLADAGELERLKKLAYERREKEETERVRASSGKRRSVAEIAAETAGSLAETFVREGLGRVGRKGRKR